MQRTSYRLYSWIKSPPRPFPSRFLSQYISYSSQSVGDYIQACHHQGSSSSSLTHLDLSLSSFSGYVGIAAHESTLSGSSLVQSLRAYGQQVTHVNVAGHQELNDLSLSRFRKELPRLQWMDLQFTSGMSSVRYYRGGNSQITVDQYSKLFAAGIVVKADNLLAHHLCRLLHAYLFQYPVTRSYAADIARWQQTVRMRDPYADSYEMCFQAAPFQQAIEHTRTQQEQERQQRDRLYEEQVIREKQIWQCLLNDYTQRREQVIRESTTTIKQTQAEVKEKALHWYLYGPANEYAFEWTELAHPCFVMYVVITQLQLWEPLAALSSNISNEKVRQQGRQFLQDKLSTHPAIQYSGHTGMTWSYCVRIMQRIAQAGSMQAMMMMSTSTATSMHTITKEIDSN